MDIGKRLRELRETKGLSQAGLEHRTGLLRCYVSRVENGHTTPSLRVLERWAVALDVELCQLFFVGHGQPQAAESPGKIAVRAQERTLLGLLGQMTIEDKALMLSLVRDLVRRKRKLG